MVEYHGEFEKMKYQMEQLNPLFSEAYFVSSFIGSMRNDIAAAMRMFKPATMFEVAEQARELVLQAPRIGNYPPEILSSQPNIAYKTGPKIPPVHYSQPFLSPKPISSYNPKHNPNTQSSAVGQPKPTLPPLPPTSQNFSTIQRNPNTCFKCGAVAAEDKIEIDRKEVRIDCLEGERA